MLLAPFVCAVILAKRVVWLEAVALAAVVLAFAAKDPLVVLFRQRFVWKQRHPEAVAAWRWLAVEVPVLLGCGALSLVYGPRTYVALFGLGAAAFGALAVWINVSNRQRSVWFQAASAIALTATALVACLAALGEIPVRGWVLWTVRVASDCGDLRGARAARSAKVLAPHRTLLARHSPPRQDRGRSHGSGRRGRYILGYKLTIPAALLLAAFGYAWELGRHTNPALVKIPLARVGQQALALSIVYGALLIAGLW